MGLKLLRKLVTGDLLVPHIEIYQDAQKFPDKWNIEIRNDKPRDGYFHPSGDCFSSPRELFLQKKDMLVRRPTRFGLQRTFDCGHFWHGYYQNILVEMGMVTPENVERKIYHERKNDKGEIAWIGTGTADLVDVVIPNKGTWLIDIKSMNDEEYDTGPRNETLKKWTAQVNCYMDWLGVKDAFILAIRKGGSPNPNSNRPSHDLREIRIPYQPDVLEDIYQRWELAWWCIQNDKMPPCAHDEDEKCGLPKEWCSYVSDAT